MLYAGSHTSPEGDLDPLSSLESYAPLVDRVVRECVPLHAGQLDRSRLTAAGTEALAAAARSYRPEPGTPFARYAAQRIREALHDEVRSAQWVDRQARRTAREISETREQLGMALGRTPSFHELAQSLGLHPDVILRDELVGQASAAEAPSELARLAAHLPAAGLDDFEPDILRHAIAELPHRLRHVVEGYFFDQQPWDLIASELQISDSQVHTLCAEALDLMQGAMTYVRSGPALPTPAGSEMAHRRRRAYYAAVAAQVASSVNALA